MPYPALHLGPDDTILIYRTQWVIVLAEVAGTDASMDHAEAATRVAEAVSKVQQHLTTNYAGRIRPEDAAINATRVGADVIVHLSLNIPVRIAEFNDWDAASTYALGIDGAEMCLRGSTRDQQISDYSKIMLPAD